MISLDPARDGFSPVVYRQDALRHCGIYNALCCGCRNDTQHSQNRIAGIFELMLFIARHKYHVFSGKWVLLALVNKNTLAFDHKYFVFVGMGV